jgi:hypothetical protein
MTLPMTLPMTMIDSKRTAPRAINKYRRNGALQVGSFQLP